MPVVFAFLASAVIHMSVLLSDGWTLPSAGEPDELEVVLLPPPAPAPAPVAATPAQAKPQPVPSSPAPKPVKRPILREAPTVPESGLVEPSVGSAQSLPAPADTLAEAPPVLPAAPEPAPEPVLALAARERLPTKGEWRYTVTRGEGGLLIGQAIYGWEHDGEHYNATSRIETVGIAALFVSAQVLQESTGEIGDSGLRPSSFRNVQKKRTDVAQIDRTRGVVANGDRESTLGEATERVQDMLSMYFQLGLILAASAPAPAEIRLPIVTGRKLDTYRFELVGEEKITRQFHDYATRHLRARNRDDVIDLWLTPELPLPLRLRIADRKGDVYEQWLDISEKGFP